MEWNDYRWNEDLPIFGVHPPVPSGQMPPNADGACIAVLRRFEEKAKSNRGGAEFAEKKSEIDFDFSLRTLRLRGSICIWFFSIGRAPDYGSWVNTHKLTSAARTC